MVKCIVDGDVLELGGPNQLELGYYYIPPSPPRMEPIQWEDVAELARNCKVVDELFDSEGIPRLKIVYIPCSDWSVRSELIIKDLMSHLVQGLVEEYRTYPGMFCDPPKVITVVQDKDYWPGSELEDPLVLQRRAAKEKDFEKGLSRHKPDHKIVKHLRVYKDVANCVELFMNGKLNEEKKKQLPRPRPYSLERYLLLSVPENHSYFFRPKDADLEELEEEKSAPIPEKISELLQFLMDLDARRDDFSSFMEEEENKHFPSAQPSSQENLSLNDTNPENLLKDKPTLFTPIVEKNEFSSAESSSFKRPRTDFAEHFLVDAPIRKKRRSLKEKRAKKYLPSAPLYELCGGESDETSKCTTSVPLEEI